VASPHSNLSSLPVSISCLALLCEDVVQTVEAAAERVSEAGKELALDLVGEGLLLTETVASPHSNLSSLPVSISCLALLCEDVVQTVEAAAERVSEAGKELALDLVGFFETLWISPVST
jgi:hypothetical protein